MLHIPTEPESWSSFYQRLGALLASLGTHTYIDASFLLWLTKVGSKSRNELFNWFERTLPNRVHVPIWAAHEYVKHHVKRTPSDDFRKTHRRISTMTRNAFTDLRPFLDDPLGNGAENPSAFRASMRDTLNRLAHLLDIAGHWPSQYDHHSSEVLSFINSATPRHTSLYSDFAAIAGHADVRLTSSIPPGFNDSHKESNQYGDLIFWNEILDHAREASASGVLVITNDVKNDWRLGGTTNTAKSDPDLRRMRTDWDPIPRPHPMLLVEARLRTSIDTVELLDSVYLGMYLRHAADPDVAKFADVALVPDVSTKHSPDTEHTHIADDPTVDPTDPSTIDSPGHVLFDDPPQVKATRPKLTRALRLSRQPLDKHSNQILSTWAAESASRTSPEQLLHSDPLNGMDHSALTALSRTLHDHALAGMPGYLDALTDALSIIQRSPNHTAASLCLGFLASMYLSRDLNESLLPPASPIAQQLFWLQTQEFASNPIFVISRHLREAEFRPIYIPASEATDVHLTLDTDPHGSSPSQLASLRFDPASPTTHRVELLTPVQADPSFRITDLFGSHAQIKGSAVIKRACELYALPESQVADDPSIDTDYSYTETLGFKDPSRVRIPTEQTNGN